MVPLCPVCDEPLVIVEFEGVETDFCARCQGVWLDEGELDLLGQAQEGDLLRQAQQAGHGAAPAKTPGGSKRRCPRCSRTMREIVVGSDPLIHLDRCVEGHGLWFDQGELRRLLAQSSPAAGRSLAYLDQVFGNPSSK